MKKKELIKLREKTVEELKKLSSDKRLELIKIESELKGGKEKNLKKVKNQRHELAQILTIVREKEIMEKEIMEKEKSKK
jgi:ribosomal protein L29